MNPRLAGLPDKVPSSYIIVAVYLFVSILTIIAGFSQRDTLLLSIGLVGTCTGAFGGMVYFLLSPLHHNSRRKRALIH
jgi:hypothetical protein